MKLVALLVTPLWGAGCWTNPPEPAAPTPSLAPSGVWHSEWRGSYVCAQGQTALHLVLDRTCPPGADCEVAGVFEFGPLASNPDVPRGSYRVTGTVATNDADELVLTVNAGAWIDRPANYLAVGFTARSDRARKRLRGTISDPWCGKLEATRQQ